MALSAGQWSNQYRVRPASGARLPAAPPAALVAQARTSTPDARPAGASLAPFYSAVVQRPNREHPEAWTRVFVDIGGTGSVQEPAGPLCTKPGCACRGKEVDHQVWRRYTRASLRERRQAVVAAGLGHLQPLQFSVHAGCKMCPCSPGFISGTQHGHNVWVDILIGPPRPADSSVVAGIIGHTPQMDSATLSLLTSSVNLSRELAASLAAHPNTPLETILQLLSYPDAQVATAASQHPRLPRHALALWQLAHDQDANSTS
jgi:hypothetical protein